MLISAELSAWISRPPEKIQGGLGGNAQPAARFKLKAVPAGIGRSDLPIQTVRTSEVRKSAGFWRAQASDEVSEASWPIRASGLDLEMSFIRGVAGGAPEGTDATLDCDHKPICIYAGVK